jgi:hypothetical protein
MEEQSMKKALARVCLVAMGGAAALGFIAGPASAAPTGAKNSFTFHADCDNGQSVDLVVNNANGQGQGTNNGMQATWAPAHVVGGNSVFHPLAFNLTFSFTSPEGTQSMTQDIARKNQVGDVTCHISGSQSDGMGDTFSVDGMVTGSIS